MNSPTPSRDAYDSTERQRGENEENENDEVVSEFLMEKSSVFTKLHTLRKSNWDNKMVKAYYKAKEAKEETEEARGKENQSLSGDSKERSYKMNEKTANELLERLGGWPGDSLLDICYAPGAFSNVFLCTGGNASYGISLPPEDKLALESRFEDERFTTEFLDITLLADEYGENASDLNQKELHKPIKSSLSLRPSGDDLNCRRVWDSKRPFQDKKFPLVICDGHVVRQKMAGESENHHQLLVSRLIFSQLMLAFQRVKENGTIVIRLYNAHRWQTVKIMHQFKKFSSIEIFKSDKNYQNSSVVYLIAKNLHLQEKAAEAALKDWKESWRQNMLGGGDNSGEMAKCDSKEEVVKVINEGFEKDGEPGKELIELGIQSWQIQLEGSKQILDKARYFKKHGKLSQEDSGTGAPTARPRPTQEKQDRMAQNWRREE